MNSTDPAERMIIRSPNWEKISWTTEKEHISSPQVPHQGMYGMSSRRVY
jgi:hypothetical protein